jgi:hypothetical protein
MVQERHIVDVYGDGGLKMVAALYDNPAQAVEIVAARLVAKGVEWSKVRHLEARCCCACRAHVMPGLSEDLACVTEL